MCTLLAKIKVHAGKEADFEDVMAYMYEQTHREEGVLRYEYWRGTETGFYYCLLSFDDHRAFIEHQVSDHHEDASPSIGECLEAFKLEYVDPVGGASDLAPTAHQDAPDGADELTLRYTDRFAARVADWWLAMR